MKLDKEKAVYQLALSKKNIEQIAEETGLSRSAITKAINGTTSPRPSTVGRIAYALGVELESILAKDIAK